MRKYEKILPTLTQITKCNVSGYEWSDLSSKGHSVARLRPFQEFRNAILIYPLQNSCTAYLRRYILQNTIYLFYTALGQSIHTSPYYHFVLLWAFQTELRQTYFKLGIKYEIKQCSWFTNCLWKDQPKWKDEWLLSRKVPCHQFSAAKPVAFT